MLSNLTPDPNQELSVHIKTVPINHLPKVKTIENFEIPLKSEEKESFLEEDDAHDFSL